MNTNEYNTNFDKFDGLKEDAKRYSDYRLNAGLLRTMMGGIREAFDGPHEPEYDVRVIV